MESRSASLVRAEQGEPPLCGISGVAIRNGLCASNFGSHVKLLDLLFPYRTHLENGLKQQREDFQERLAEKNLQIRVLRVELAAAKTQQKPVVELPTQTKPAPPAPAVFDGDWRGELNTMLDKEIEDGIRSRGRIQEHEQSADDGA